MKRLGKGYYRALPLLIGPLVADLWIYVNRGRLLDQRAFPGWLKAVVCCILDMSRRSRGLSKRDRCFGHGSLFIPPCFWVLGCTACLFGLSRTNAADAGAGRMAGAIDAEGITDNGSCDRCGFGWEAGWACSDWLR